MLIAGDDRQDQLCRIFGVVKHRYRRDLSRRIDTNRMARIHVAVEMRKRTRRHLEPQAMSRPKAVRGGSEVDFEFVSPARFQQRGLIVTLAPATTEELVDDIERNIFGRNVAQ